MKNERWEIRYEKWEMKVERCEMSDKLSKHEWWKFGRRDELELGSATGKLSVKEN